jgi:hypothetical protein
VRVRRTVIPAVGVILLAAAAGPAHAAGQHSPNAARVHTVTIQTYPPSAGARFRLGTQILAADGRGRLQIAAATWASLRSRLHYVPRWTGPTERLRFDRWSGAFYGSRLDRLNAYLATWYLVRPTFQDSDGRPIEPRMVTSATVRSSTGDSRTVAAGRPVWLKGLRVALGPAGPHTKVVTYHVDSVVAGGTQVVFHAQQKFAPARAKRLLIQLRLYWVRFVARDAIFGFPTGHTLRLTYPDGHVDALALGRGSALRIGPLPRGTYHVSVGGAVLGGSRPLALSQDQDVRLDVISRVDVATVGGALLLMATAIPLIGRPGIRRPLRRAARLASGQPRRARPGAQP